MKRSFLLFALIGSLTFTYAQAQTSPSLSARSCQKICPSKSMATAVTSPVLITKNVPATNEQQTILPDQSAPVYLAALNTSATDEKADLAACCSKTNKPADGSTDAKTASKNSTAGKVNKLPCDKQQKAKKKPRPSSTVKLVKN